MCQQSAPTQSNLHLSIYIDITAKLQIVQRTLLINQIYKLMHLGFLH